jgi:hypothetical protein
VPQLGAERTAGDLHDPRDHAKLWLMDVDSPLSRREALHDVLAGAHIGA